MSRHGKGYAELKLLEWLTLERDTHTHTHTAKHTNFPSNSESTSSD